MLTLAGTSCTKDETLENVRISATDEATTRVSIREILEVETDTVGQLAEKIGDRKDIVQKLIIHGPIDAVDVRTIRSLPALLSIDMKEATICGGDSTYTVNGTSYRLYDNIIGEHMFSNIGTPLGEFVLPDNIVEIGAYAFSGVDTPSYGNPFVSITIPEGVTRICEKAFWQCGNLETVILPSTLRYIDEEAFSSCGKLHTINLEEGLETIGMYAFSGCKELESIDFPSSLTKLGYACFRQSGLVSVTLPEGITDFETIGAPANYRTDIFESCVALETAVLPDNMTEIPNGLFYGCHNLSSVTLPKNLKTIGMLAFYENYALKNIDLPETLERIEDSAFQHSGLQTLVLPNSVNYLEKNCFDFCDQLESLTLSSQLVQLPEGVFSRCSRLTDIVWPEGSIESLGTNCFSQCTSLTSVTLPNSVTDIGDYCFQNCSNLSTIRFSEALKNIGMSAFSDCAVLDSIVLPGSLERIGNYCFTRCSGLSEVVLAEGLKNIERCAFSECTSLTTITIPKSVTSVDSDVFDKCANLTSIFWNTSIDVPDRLFSGNGNTNTNFWKNPYCLLYLADGTTVVNDPMFKNIIINGVAEEIVLSSEMGNFHVPQAFKAAKVTYTRDFTYPTYPGEAAGWRSISLPFTVTEITGPEGQTLAPFNANVEGAKPFWLRRLTENGFEDVTEIEAGVPYIIAMPNNEAYNDEYNINGTVTFTAQSAAGIDFPATDEMTRDVGPDFVLNANYNYRPMGTSVYALNETATDTRHAGSVFVRNERDLMPFEGYVSSALITSGLPDSYSIFGSKPATRGTRPLGPVPSIDDM